MTRILRLGLGIVFAASVCLPAVATARSTAAEPPRDPVVKVFVEYGDPPVTAESGQHVRISFAGRRGDIVNLRGVTNDYGDHVALRSAGREVSATWGDGYYRLRATRRHTFSVHLSSDDLAPSTLLLEKLVLRSLTRDGAPRWFSKRRGFVPAVSFDLKPNERTMIRTPGYSSYVLADHEEKFIYGDPILEVGQGLASARGDSYDIGSPLSAGEVIVLAGRKGTVQALGSDIVPVALDGAVARVPARLASREVALRFPATAGQLVHLSGVPDSTQVSPTMYGSLTSTMHANGGRVWRVVETGVQTIGLFPAVGTPVSVGAASVTRIGSMAAGGPALTFTVPEPGRWVYADVDFGYFPILTASGSTFAPGVPWSATVTEALRHSCLDPLGPLGCGEQGVATVSETTPQASNYFGLSSESFVFLAVPPGISGSVDLQVTKRLPSARSTDLLGQLR
jgi:hypothetical protein